MKMHGSPGELRKALAAVLVVVCASCASTGPATFETPDAAMNALADAIATHDSERAEELFGEGGLDLLRSGDEVADRDDAEQVQEYIRTKVAFEDVDAETKIALLGEEGWPFPIPLMKEDGGWCFDVETGVEEIANRRIGRNELSTIATMHEYVDAQREYASIGRDNRPPAYASKLLSTTGQHDGLYWRVAGGEPESPLGPLIAAAAEEGYASGEDDSGTYHGYRFRLLTRQGKNAPGGERDYVDATGLMTRGYAMLAWPAKYGNSGVMTFLVGPQGIVYQKDLGEETEKVAKAITAFDPDESWDPTGD